MNIQLMAKSKSISGGTLMRRSAWFPRSKTSK